MEVIIENIFNNKTQIIKQSFFSLMSVEILGAVVNSLNSTIDTVVIGQFLSVEAMAAVGFFSPMLTIISLVWIIIIGLQIICGKFIGKGDKESLESLFATAVVFLGAIALIASIICFAENNFLAKILGAQGETAKLLQEYIKGYSIGIIGQVYCALLMWFLAFNYDIKLSRIVIALMIISNFFLDIFFISILDLGIFGLGLASSFSYLLSAGVMLQSFFHKNKPIQLKFKKFLFAKLLKSARFGIPSLTFNVGLTAKAYLLNITLMNYIGMSAVAVMNVQGAVIGVLGSIPVGCGNAFLALGSLWFGSRDKESLLILTKITLKYTLLASVAIMILIMISSPVAPNLFFSQNEEAFEIAERMLFLFPSFLVLNALVGIFLKIYQIQKKSEFLVSSMPIFENLLIAILAVISVPFLGVDAVWLSFPATEIICLAIIAISVFIHSKKISFKLEDWMKLDKNFGVDKKFVYEKNFATIDDATTISMEVINFCKQKNFPKNKAYFAGLAIEEIATNIIQYGFTADKKYNAYVRVTVEDEICIRIYDNASTFNLKEKLQNSIGKFPEEDNISLRIIEKILEKIDYQNNAGINTVVLVV